MHEKQTHSSVFLTLISYLHAPHSRVPLPKWQSGLLGIPFLEHSHSQMKFRTTTTSSLKPSGLIFTSDVPCDGQPLEVMAMSKVTCMMNRNIGADHISLSWYDQKKILSDKIGLAGLNMLASLSDLLCSPLNITLDLTSSPMEIFEHFLPLSPVSLTPFMQWDTYEMDTPSGSLLFSRITSDDRD